LERAAKKFGEPRLASLLEISPTKLRFYLKGSVPVPDDLLLRAIDLVLEAATNPEREK
jgi:hypothetical protein